MSNDDEQNDNQINNEPDATSIAAKTEATQPSMPTPDPVPTPPLTQPQQSVVESPTQPNQAQTFHSSPATLVLQWLTYAFWGWLIVGLIWLVAVLLLNALVKTDISDVVPFAVASSLVLLPIAFFTDKMYRKREPDTKTGAATVIMIIHAVLFALLGIGVLIGVFVNILRIVLDIGGDMNFGDDMAYTKVATWTLAFAALMYALVFVRTLQPFKYKRTTFLYSIVMLVVSSLLLLLAVIGPVLTSARLQNDRLIEAGLPGVKSSIDAYVQDNNKLPNSLTDLDYDYDQSQEIVDKKLVEYIKEDSVEDYTSTLYATTSFRYQLCVDYQEEGTKNRYYDYDDSPASDEYRTYLSTTRHEKGRQCYKLKQTTYQDDYEFNIKVREH